MTARIVAARRRWSGSLTSPGSREARVHAARVVLKEARAVVRLYREETLGFDALRWEERLREARRALGPARDEVVTRATLSRLAESLPEAEDRAAVVRALPRPQAVDAASLEAVAPLVEELVREWKQRVRAAGWGAVDTALEASCRALAKQQRRAGKTKKAEVWHRWRRRAKELAFQLDWVQPPDRPGWRRLRESVWRLQSHLGELQDLQVTLARLDTLDVPERVARTLRRAVRHAIRVASHRAWHDRLRRRDWCGEGIGPEAGPHTADHRDDSASTISR